MRSTLLLSAALAALLAEPVSAQTHPETPPAPRSDGVLRERDPDAVPRADRRVAPEAQGNGTVPGTTPGANIGGTPTAGAPGTGGAAGGPSIGN